MGRDRYHQGYKEPEGGVRPAYLADYANEMAWREDVRRFSIRTQVDMLTVGHSWWWRGYYQGKRRGTEILMNQGIPPSSASGVSAQ